MTCWTHNMLLIQLTRCMSLKIFNNFHAYPLNIFDMSRVNIYFQLNIIWQKHHNNILFTSLTFTHFIYQFPTKIFLLFMSDIYKYYHSFIQSFVRSFIHSHIVDFPNKWIINYNSYCNKYFEVLNEQQTRQKEQKKCILSIRQ